MLFEANERPLGHLGQFILHLCPSDQIDFQAKPRIGIEGTALFYARRHHTVELEKCARKTFRRIVSVFQRDFGHFAPLGQFLPCKREPPPADIFPERDPAHDPENALKMITRRARSAGHLPVIDLFTKMRFDIVDGALYSLDPIHGFSLSAILHQNTRSSLDFLCDYLQDIVFRKSTRR